MRFLNWLFLLFFPSPTGINVRLLRKVERHILAEPRRLDMGYWAGDNDATPCNTAGCIAGWTEILSGESVASVKERGGCIAFSDIPHTAAAHLRLARDQALLLFHTTHWPDNFYDAYYAHPRGSRGRARATADRIEHFIKTNGAE